jgi:DNA helicase-2/ATP-dependent DNA helicase PcrA
MDYINSLNSGQKQAVTSMSRFIRVNAGAGSGKTRVLACRIAYLIDNYGVSENSILAITFTNKVAREMKERVNLMLGVESSCVLISTYHSFCARVLREDISSLNEGYDRYFTIIDDEEQVSVCKDLLKKEKVDKEDLNYKELVNYISYYKCLGTKPSEVETFNTDQEQKKHFYELYEEYLKEHSYLDFDDLLLKTVRLFEKNERIRNKWSNRFQYILVDEFQDTNDIQYRLLKYLVSEDTSLFVVGDPDQTIYSWRGANIQLIMNFNRDFKNVEDIKLERNYRSTQPILNAANELIKVNNNRLEKDLYSDKTEGKKPQFFDAENSEKEAEYVVNKIMDLRGRGYDYKDIALLYRSSYYTRNFEQALMKRKIPYRIFGGLRFYQRKEIKDALAYLRVVVNENDDQALLRIINEPRRGIGDKTLSNLKEDSVLYGHSIYRVVKENKDAFKKKDLINEMCNAIEIARYQFKENIRPFSDIMNDLLKQVGYIDMLSEDEEENENRLQNIDELGSVLMDIQKETPDKGIEEILQDIALYSAQDDIMEGNYVSLMTVHTAKGLEFPVVFVVGLGEGVFPNQRAVIEKVEGLEEERRLCYVAVTRAMKECYLTSNTGYSFVLNGSTQVSRFINEMRNNIDYLNKSKRPSYLNNLGSSSSVNTNKINKPVSGRVFGEETKSNASFRNGTLVEHVAFGEGIVIGVEGSNLRIAFKNNQYGVKLISSSFKGLTIKGG